MASLEYIGRVGCLLGHLLWGETDFGKEIGGKKHLPQLQHIIYLVVPGAVIPCDDYFPTYLILIHLNVLFQHDVFLLLVLTLPDFQIVLLKVNNKIGLIPQMQSTFNFQQEILPACAGQPPEPSLYDGRSLLIAQDLFQLIFVLFAEDEALPCSLDGHCR